MDTKDIIQQLRKDKGLSQEELAQQAFVTRQAVSRWETGETIPNTDTLKVLSQLFDVSINTLLGSPRKLVCQCCGMPLEDSIMAHNIDGTLNESYCKWCYEDGKFTYHDMNTLINVSAKHMAQDGFSEEDAKAYLKELLSTLDHWKRYDALSDDGQYEEYQRQLIQEINDLKIEGMPEVKELKPVLGKFVNLAYPTPSGEHVKLLDDKTTYLCTELDSEILEDGFHFGIVAGMGFILISTYEGKGENPELLYYYKR